MTSDRFIGLVMSAYLTGAAVTWGLVAAEQERPCAELYSNEKNPRVVRDRDKCVQSVAFFGAMVWPLYWPAKITYEIARD